MRKKKPLSPLLIICAALGLAWLVRVFGLDLYIIRGDSMVPSAANGNIALILRSAYGLPKPLGRGYIWRWKDPLPRELVVAHTNDTDGLRALKRVFDVGPAYLRVEQGILYARGGSVQLSAEERRALRIRFYLEPGSVFLLGDNAGFSYDSRNYGAIPIENIQGKVLVFIPNPLQAIGLWKR